MAKNSGRAKKAVAYNLPESWIEVKDGAEKFTLTVPVFKDGADTGKKCRVLGVPITREIGGDTIHTVQIAHEFSYFKATKNQKAGRRPDPTKPIDGVYNIDFGYAQKSDGNPYCLYVRMDGEKETKAIPVTEITGMIKDALAGKQQESKKRLLLGDKAYEELKSMDIPETVDEDDLADDNGLKDEGIEAGD